MTEKLVSANLRNFEKNFQTRREALLDSSNKRQNVIRSENV